MTRWIDISKRGPTDKDMDKSHRRGTAVFLVCTRDGLVGEWHCLLTPFRREPSEELAWFPTWMVPPDWCGDTVVTHWRRIPRPPGEFWARVKWWLRISR